MVARRIILLPVSVNALEIYLLGLCVATGIRGLIGIVAEGSTDLLPTWLNLCWYLLLFLGGGIAIVGNYWSDKLLGLLLVRAAMWPLSGGAVIYAATLAVRGSWGQSLTVFLFGVTTLFRTFKISQQLNNLMENSR